MAKLESSAASLPAVPGRLEKMDNQAPFQVFVDYAHTPDAMETVLSTLRDAYPSRRLITVFGCGGDRDKGKRPMMGEIATRLSTEIIITDDNPRSEASEAIISQIVSGCSDRQNYQVIPNRSEAVEAALKMAGHGDIVAILGKGHEPYQEIDGERRPYSDMLEVDTYMEQHGYSV
jgi:UDP-N-acetylmuramoyl-L-alanyl-D-glutamate--2,6-diaminopimelate ligase